MVLLSELVLSVGSILIQGTASQARKSSERAFAHHHAENSPALSQLAPLVSVQEAETSARSESADVIESTPSASRVKKSKLAKLEDGELLQIFQSGNEEAFYVLFERRHKEIFTHCLRMCSGDNEKAKDAFQDTFVKVFTRSDLFTEATNGRAWLYRIATNTCLNQLRYDKRHPKESLEPTVSSIDPSMQPDFGSEQDSLRSALEAAVAKLPIELREPFLLRELEEFSYEEVSEQLGITVAACRQRVYRAKQILREELEDVVSGMPPLGKRKGDRK